MLKRVVYTLLLFTLLFGSAQAFTFKVATLSPDGSFWMQKMREGAKEIEAKTESRVKFKFYPGGVMGDAKGVLRKMRLHQLHGAAMTNGGLNKIYPDIQVYNLILKFDSLEEVDYVRNKMDETLTAGLEEQGIVSFGFAEIGQAYLMSLFPIHTLTDMSSEKAWVPDNNEIALAAFQAFQVSPIPLPIRDVLMGLQTGMISAAAGSPIGALALQWHTKIKYVLDLPLSYISGVLMLDKKAFIKISEADQHIVREVLVRVIKEVDKQSRIDNINALNALKNQDITFITPTAAATDELRHLIVDVNKKLMKTGRLSQQIVDDLNKHLTDYRAK